MVIGEVIDYEVYMCPHGQLPGAALGLSRSTQPHGETQGACASFSLANDQGQHQIGFHQTNGWYVELLPAVVVSRPTAQR